MDDTVKFFKLKEKTLAAELDRVRRILDLLTGGAPVGKVYVARFPNTCIACNKSFNAKKRSVKFCSRECSYDYRSQHTPVKGKGK